MAGDDSTVWVRTSPTGDGSGYTVVVETDEDHAFSLTFDEAMHHARTLLWACAYAEYDASVYRQIRARVSAKEAFALVQDLQAARPPLDVSGCGPFVYLPGLTREDREPVIQLTVEGRAIGLWPLDQAREHALTLIEATCVAELDAAYLSVLQAVVGLEQSTASAVVGGLADYRP